MGVRCPFCPPDKFFKSMKALRDHQRTVGHRTHLPDYEAEEDRRRLEKFREYDRDKRA